MKMMKLAWQRNSIIFQNVSLESYSNIGSLRNSRKKKRKLYLKRRSLLLQEKGNLDVYKASNENTISKIAEMEEIKKEMSTDSQSINAFSVVMGPEHLERLRLYGLGITKMAILHQLSMQQMMWYNKCKKECKKWRNKLSNKGELCDKKLLQM